MHVRDEKVLSNWNFVFKVQGWVAPTRVALVTMPPRGGPQRTPDDHGPFRILREVLIKKHRREWGLDWQAAGRAGHVQTYLAARARQMYDGMSAAARCELAVAVLADAATASAVPPAECTRVAASVAVTAIRVDAAPPGVLADLVPVAVPAAAGIPAAAAAPCTEIVSADPAALGANAPVAVAVVAASAATAPRRRRLVKGPEQDASLPSKRACALEVASASDVSCSSPAVVAASASSVASVPAVQNNAQQPRTLRLRIVMCVHSCSNF
jgi:hypothetical protein